MAETVSSQAALVADLTRQIANNGGGGGGANSGVGSYTTIKNYKHECKKCKRMVWQKGADCS